MLSSYLEGLGSSEKTKTEHEESIPHEQCPQRAGPLFLNKALHHLETKSTGRTGDNRPLFAFSGKGLAFAKKILRFKASSLHAHTHTRTHTETHTPLRRWPASQFQDKGKTRTRTRGAVVMPQAGWPTSPSSKGAPAPSVVSVALGEAAGGGV